MQGKDTARKVYAINRPYMPAEHPVIPEINQCHDGKTDQIILDRPHLISVRDNAVVILGDDNGLHNDAGQGQNDHRPKHPDIRFRTVYPVELYAGIHRVSHLFHGHLLRFFFLHSLQKIGFPLVLDVGGDLREHQLFCMFISNLFCQGI